MSVKTPAPHRLPLDQLAALKVSEAAQLISVSAPSIRRAIRDGALPAITIIGGCRIRRTDLDAYINSAKDWEPAAAIA